MSRIIPCKLAYLGMKVDKNHGERFQLDNALIAKFSMKTLPPLVITELEGDTSTAALDVARAGEIGSSLLINSN